MGFEIQIHENNKSLCMQFFDPWLLSKLHVCKVHLILDGLLLMLPKLLAVHVNEGLHISRERNKKNRAKQNRAHSQA